MLQREHSATLLTFIKLPFVIKIFGLSIFEWQLKTGFTVFILQKRQLCRWFMFSLLLCLVKEIRKKSWFSHTNGIQKMSMSDTNKCAFLSKSLHAEKNVMICCHLLIFFSDLSFSKISFRNTCTIRVPNSLDLTKLQHYSGPRLKIIFIISHPKYMCCGYSKERLDVMVL